MNNSIAQKAETLAVEVVLLVIHNTSSSYKNTKNV